MNSILNKTCENAERTNYPEIKWVLKKIGDFWTNWISCLHLKNVDPCLKDDAVGPHTIGVQELRKGLRQGHMGQVAQALD